MRKISFVLICLSAMVFLGACTGTTNGAGTAKAYKGKGGMTAYDISSDVYLHHYEHGFTGVDAMGWDPNLQYAWSRVGAAKACGLKFDEKKIIQNLSKTYKHDPWVHEINGVEFHYLHAKTAEQTICKPGNIEELKVLMKQFEAGNFPKKY